MPRLEVGAHEKSESLFSRARAYLPTGGDLMGFGNTDSGTYMIHVGSILISNANYALATKWSFICPSIWPIVK